MRSPSTLAAPSLSETVASRLQADSDKEIERWLERDHHSILQRITRLTVVDDEYRLDRLDQIVPPEIIAQINYEIGDVHCSIWRGLPNGKDIRPGDWVALNSEYAHKHRRHVEGEAAFSVKNLPLVLASDVYWAGTDKDEYFFLPAAWRRTVEHPATYLRELSTDQLRSLCDGEQSSITRHQKAIDRLEDFILDHFDHDACGIAHGPAHWRRVQDHGTVIARSLGIDPLIPHIFGLVHDSQRQDEGTDPGHGRRAAEFVLAERTRLFDFLSNAEVEQLAHACELHSDGHTHSEHTSALACWDADRLDLGRVGIEPDPRHLCTSYARDEHIIEAAIALSERVGMEFAEQRFG